MTIENREGSSETTEAGRKPRSNPSADAVLKEEPVPPSDAKASADKGYSVEDSNRKSLIAEREFLKKSIKERDGFLDHLRTLHRQNFDAKYPDTAKTEEGDELREEFVELKMNNLALRNSTPKKSYSYHSSDQEYIEPEKLTGNKLSRELSATRNGLDSTKEQFWGAAREIISTYRKTYMLNGMSEDEAAVAAQKSFVNFWQRTHDGPPSFRQLIHELDVPAEQARGQSRQPR